MSKANRIKGAAFEREIAKTLSEELGQKVWRNLEQVRSSGSDLMVGGWAIECKRRARISIYEWIEQAQKASGGSRYAVVFRSDAKKAHVIITLDEFIHLLRTEKLGF